MLPGKEEEEDEEVNSERYVGSYKPSMICNFKALITFAFLISTEVVMALLGSVRLSDSPLDSMLF